MNKKTTCAGIFLIALSMGLRAQQAPSQAVEAAKPTTEEPKKFEPTLHIKGFTQLNFAYGQNKELSKLDNPPMGFNFKRIRCMPYGELSEKASWGIMFNADNMAVGITTVYFNYKLIKDLVQVKAGLIDNSAALYGSGNSTSNLVLIQQPQVIQDWGTKFMTNGYFDLGVKIHGKTKILNYGVMLANADAKTVFDKTGLTYGTYTHDNNGLKGIGRFAVTPVEGLEVGIFDGIAVYKKISTKDTTYIAYSGGVDGRYDAHNVYTHFGYIMGNYALTATKQVSYNGFYLHAGYKISFVMPTAGFEMFTPNTDIGQTLTNITGGLDFIINKNLKIQTNYIMRLEKNNSVDNNLVMLNLQYVFDKKNL